jgi:Tfp pilus assembly protein PilF
VGLIVALLVGAVVRAAQLWWASAHVPDFAAPMLDAGFHHYWASLIVDATTQVPAWMDDPEVATTPYYRPPGYVWALAAVYALSGGSIVAAKVVQAAVGLGGVAIVYALGRRLLDARAATAGALAAALSPSLLYFEGELVAAALASVLVTSWAWLALSPRSPSPSLLRASLLGALVGVACWVRPSLVVLAPVLLVVWAWRLQDGGDEEEAGPRPSKAHARAAWSTAGGVFVVAVVLVTAPVTVRNLIVGGEAVWISMNAPITARYGNHAAADGHHVRLPTTGVLAGLTTVSASGYPRVRRHVAEQLGRPVVSEGSDAGEATLGWGELGSILRKESMSWAAGDQAAFAALTIRKALLLIGPAEVSNNKQVQLAINDSPVLRWLPARWRWVAPLALVGVVALWRRRRRRASALLFGGVSLLLATVVPFLAAARFRLPTLGLVTALAGVGLIALLDSLRDPTRAGDRGPLLAAGLVGALLFGVNWTGYRPDESRWRLDRATALLRADDDDGALVELDAALAQDSRNADAYRQRGLLHARRGAADLALQDLQQAVALGGGPAADAALATVKTQLGATDTFTLRQFEALLEKDPDRTDVLYNYGLALSRRGRPADARVVYERLLALTPASADARNNLGRVLLQLNDPRGAIAHFDAVLTAEPDHVQAAYNRAVAYARVDVQAAEEAYRALLDRRPDHVEARLNLGALLLDSGRPVDALQLLAPAASSTTAPSGILFNYARAAWQSGNEPMGLAALRRAKTARQRGRGAPGPGADAIDLQLAAWLTTASTPSLRAPDEAVALTHGVVLRARWGHPLPIRAYAAALDAAGKPDAAAQARQRADVLCAAQPGGFDGACAP